MNNAIRLDPEKRPAFFHNRGLLHFTMRHYQEALDDLMHEVRTGSLADGPRIMKK